MVTQSENREGEERLSSQAHQKFNKRPNVGGCL